MKIVFISNFINHHQVHLADEFYKIIGEGYKFIETEPMPESFIKNGYPDYSARAYVVKAYSSSKMHEYAIKCAYEADVAVIGSAPEYFITKRIQETKLTFRYNERWFRNKPWFLTGPRGWINFWKNHIRHRNKPLYMLCASAFTAKDVNAIGAYKNKCFKWGYFTKVDDLEIDELRARHSLSRREVRIMWCARFIDLKHPELPVKLAARLKEKGYNFVINMFGSGEKLEHTKLLAKHLNVKDCVVFRGNRPNELILEEMRNHDIFLFTSDKNEGWGAVLNEAMSNGCVAVGSNQIGSVPFLIEDDINGCIFKSEDLDSLYTKVAYLIDNPVLRCQMAIKAYETMKYTWSPQNAAKQFLNLVSILNGCRDVDMIDFGPCSKAIII